MKNILCVIALIIAFTSCKKDSQIIEPNLAPDEEALNQLLAEMRVPQEAIFKFSSYTQKYSFEPFSINETLGFSAYFYKYLIDSITQEISYIDMGRVFLGDIECAKKVAGVMVKDEDKDKLKQLEGKETTIKCYKNDTDSLITSFKVKLPQTLVLETSLGNSYEVYDKDVSKHKFLWNVDESNNIGLIADVRYDADFGLFSNDRKLIFLGDDGIESFKTFMPSNDFIGTISITLYRGDVKNSVGSDGIAYRLECLAESYNYINVINSKTIPIR